MKRSGAVRDQAVENVDARHGYTCEFSSDPESHVQEYDEEETRLYAKVLTSAQRRALGGLVNIAVQGKTAKQLFVRSDVLWRLEEAGLVTRSFTDLWRITPNGEAAYYASRQMVR